MSATREEVNDDITVAVTIRQTSHRSLSRDQGAHWDAAGNLTGTNSPERVAEWLRAKRRG